MDKPDPVRETRRRGPLAGLRRRVFLTYRYHGIREVLRRALGFPRRFGPEARRLGLGRAMLERRAQAGARFASNARPVTIVIPSFGAAAEVRRAVRSVRRTTPAHLVSIIVCDDAGPSAELVTLRQTEGIELLASDRNQGFAASANRGLERAAPGSDVVLLNPDVVAHPGWLECLQYAAYGEAPDVGIVGARLLYPDRTIQHAGLHRNSHAPEWFDHYYRSGPPSHGPADVPHPVLAVTGACLYAKRELIDRIGLLDPGYSMAYEDVDWCLRAWEAGYQVVYEPAAILEHVEATTRGAQPGDRELASQLRFWRKWTPFFDRRDVHCDGGHLRIVYVTEGTILGGGHRVVFEDINRLAERGHDVSLYTLQPPPQWFDLKVPVRTFSSYDELVAELAPLDAIKVATWWTTAPAVWRASVVHGVPVYFVQDIETSYYPDSQAARHRVLATYRTEFRYLTTSAWNRDRLAELGRPATLVPAGVDLETFRPLDVPRREDMMLAIARKNPLKRFDLTLAAWRELPQPRPELCLFGPDGELAPVSSRYLGALADEQVNELLNQCTLFVLTSSHEGFALPPLEAMAAGAPVVCTDADGNRDYCSDRVNCVIVSPEPAAIAAAIRLLLDDPGLRQRLAAAGLKTAARYGLDRRTDELERFFRDLADSARGARPAAAPRE